MVTVRLIKSVPPLNAGELAGFPDDQAEKLVQRGSAIYVDKDGKPIEHEGQLRVGQRLPDDQQKKKPGTAVRDRRGVALDEDGSPLGGEAPGQVGEDTLGLGSESAPALGQQRGADFGKEAADKARKK